MMFACRAQQLEPTLRPERGVWTHVLAPSDEERAALLDLGVPDELIADALDKHEIARVEHHSSGAQLFVLRVPADASSQHDVIALGVIVLQDMSIITLSAERTGIPVLLAKESIDARKPMQLCLKLALRTAESFIQNLHETEREISELEAKIKSSLENDEVLALLDRQKRLVHFDLALRVNQDVMERTMENNPELEAAERVLVEDALVELKQAGLMTHTTRELLSATMDALATVVSNNLNVAMKKLASLTLLISVPALFAGVYGMNVSLPIEKNPWAFFIVLGLAAAVAAVLAIYLRARRWL